LKEIPRNDFMATLLFVYGTLKDGFSRSSALKDQRYIGTAKTTKEYGMYAHGGFPALVDNQLAATSNVEAKNSIYGELYEVDDNCLIALDKIEGVEFDLFGRKIVNLEQFYLLRLPFYQSTFDLLDGKKSQAYFFRRSVTGCADCGSFWARR
jgi:gamma-glutamylcyclotransferase (GGCT)/AIG2-like uncharacterized protein YtfP